MKKLSFFLIVACMAMTSAIAAADGTLFYEDPVYKVMIVDSANIDAGQDIAIKRMTTWPAQANNDIDAYQMNYNQANCDRCHKGKAGLSKAEPNKGFVIFSVNEKQPTTTIMDHRHRL